MPSISAQQVYDRQNRIIHKGMASIGMPYGEYKEEWITVCREICGRENIESLKDMTIGERRELIARIAARGADLFNPWVSPKISDWMTGDEDMIVSYHTRRKTKGYPGRPKNMSSVTIGPMLRKVEALLAEAKRQWKYAHRIAERVTKGEKQRVQLCTPEELRKVIAALMYDAKRHGRYLG